MRTGERVATLVVGFVVWGILTAPAAAGPKRAPVPEPELRIVEVTTSPETYEPSGRLLDLAVQVELPEHVDTTALLEVSSLISSPSKRSVRYLASRQPISELADPASTGTPPRSDNPRVVVVLTWDGRDQTREFVRSGRYNYEVRAKLFRASEKGPRTLMVSWPKRGVIDVK